MPKELTIQLDAKGEKLTVKSLVEALEKALAILRKLDPNAEWEVVRVTKRSPFRIVLKNPNSDNVIPDYMRGLRGFSQKPTGRPRKQIRAALQETRELTDVLCNGIESIRFSYPGQKPILLTPAVAKAVTISARAESEIFYEWTTVRGKLYQITVGNEDTRFRVQEQISGNDIPCTFQPETLEHIKEALPHRVDVFGKAKSSRTKGIISIEADTVTVLTDDCRRLNELPAIDITGGISSAEHVERVRSGD